MTIPSLVGTLVLEKFSTLLHPGEKLVGSFIEPKPGQIAYRIKTTEGREIGAFGIEDYLDEIIAEYGIDGARDA